MFIFIRARTFCFKSKHTVHKFLNVLKPFLIVCTDGYIVEVTGPHAAKQSDASIVQKMLNDEEHPFHCFFFIMGTSSYWIEDLGIGFRILKHSGMKPLCQRR